MGSIDKLIKWLILSIYDPQDIRIFGFRYFDLLTGFSLPVLRSNNASCRCGLAYILYTLVGMLLILHMLLLWLKCILRRPDHKPPDFLKVIERFWS